MRHAVRMRRWRHEAVASVEHQHMLPHPPHLLNLLGAAENTYIAVLGSTEDAYVGVHEGWLEDMGRHPEEMLPRRHPQEIHPCPPQPPQKNRNEKR